VQPTNWLDEKDRMVITGRVDWTDRAAELRHLVREGLWLPGPTAPLEVLGLTEVERAHQAHIAWLLSPQGTHGLGSGVLVNLLRCIGSADVSAGQLSDASVKTEDIRPHSRPDIVVSMPGTTLVIEVKVHANEGVEQTRRQADDYADSPDPQFVFLTFRGEEPGDSRFTSVRFMELANCIRAALASAHTPRNKNEELGRSTANGYLYALERMCGVEQINQHAALFWLRHGRDMDAAEAEAARLLKMLPDRIAADLTHLAKKLGSDLQIARIPYVAVGKKASYPEIAVLLYRRDWRGADGSPRFGIGAGQRTKDVDPFDSDKSLFVGVWAEDPVARAELGDGEWDRWAWWKAVDLTPPDDGADLLTWYTSVAVRDVERAWQESAELIDRLVDRHPAGVVELAAGPAGPRVITVSAPDTATGPVGAEAVTNG
jgi:PD-(D/E)XK nuclease superfamily